MVVGWTDNGMDWTIDRTGYPTEFSYMSALMSAFRDRKGLYDGVAASANANKVGIPHLRPDSLPSWFDAYNGLEEICRKLNYVWFNTDTSSQWIDRRTLDYGAINGTPYASLGIATWTRTSMRAYLESTYGYGDLWDKIMSVTSDRNTWLPYTKLLRGSGLSWRWMKFFYVVLNLLTVKYATVVGATSGVQRQTRYDRSAAWADAVTAFNSKSITSDTASASVNYATHNTEFITSDGRYWITREAGTVNIHCGVNASTVTSHDIRMTAIAKVVYMYEEYENSDFTADENDAVIIFDDTSANYWRNFRVMGDYMDDNATVTEPSTPDTNYGWKVDPKANGFSIADAGITGGFSYQDDTV